MTHSPNILIVDDQKTFRELNCSALRSGGFVRLTCAMDGMEALEIFRRQTFDLVISDLEMPRMTGLELTEAIRSGSENAGTPIILLTSRADATFVMQARKLAVSAYLLKPAAPTQLIQAAKRALNPPEILPVRAAAAS